MWPSLETATRIGDIANVALVVSLVVGVIATGAVVWAGNRKEEHLRRELSAAGTEAAKATESAARAMERAAVANEAAEREKVARLKLEARLADRSLSPEAATALRALAAHFPGARLDICTFGASMEIATFAHSINQALASGGWVVRQWQALTGSVRGVVLASDPAKPSTAAAVAKLVLALTADNLGAVAVPFSQLDECARQGPGEPMDAPLRMYIGSK